MVAEQSPWVGAGAGAGVGGNPSVGAGRSSLLDVGSNTPFPAEQNPHRASSCERPGCSFEQKRRHTGRICRASPLCAASRGP